jgi:predicted 3-demethylubiquinone-9 3-methyltransferase (glyoxalase superfamily)
MESPELLCLSAASSIRQRVRYLKSFSLCCRFALPPFDKLMKMQKITPHLWFDKLAREAAEFYVSLFPGSKAVSVTKLTGTPSGDCDLVRFELAGQPFMAISAGPLFKFNPSVSFHVNCGTKEEVDAIWEHLSLDAKVLMPLGEYPFSARYGWLEDKYGLSWQIMLAAQCRNGRRKQSGSSFALRRGRGAGQGWNGAVRAVFASRTGLRRYGVCARAQVRIQ